MMHKDWPELAANQNFIYAELHKEEERFSKTLAQGLKEFEKLVDGFAKAFAKTGKKITEISGKHAFRLYDTFGFPLEMTQELAAEQGLTVNTVDFEAAYKKHQEKSRQGAEAKFKGGLADNSQQTTRLHTATHLLHKALQMVLGETATQKGSNITAERLRFDFIHDQKMTPEQLQQVEQIVNEQIQRGLPVSVQEMTVQEAQEQGAIGLFTSKYGEKVKVYSVGDFSKEMCGGPHVANTKELGHFKIKKEESSSAGVRRIRAVLKTDE
jgi:alanyl-tRNA synthetase